ncbi:MAG: P-type conjugative transfer protein TrbJ [Alphaproteobacteria bacterium]
MIRIRHLAASSAVALSLVLAAPGHAQWIVYDPSNYAQNVLQAARALEQISNQVTSLQNEAQMLINQARQLASLPMSVQDQIEGSFAQMQGLLRQADRIAYDVQAIEQQFQQGYQDFGSDRTDQQLVDGARERWQASVSALQHALMVGAGAVETLPQVQTQVGTLVGASQSAVGVLQATQAGNQLLAVQSQQLADLTAMLAAQGRAAALEEARRAAAQVQAREQVQRFMAPGEGYRPTTVRMFHE